jgi:glycosyltransferase involved in cell wall biosynthesis
VVSIGPKETNEKIEGVRKWKAFSWWELLFRHSLKEHAKKCLWLMRPGIEPSIDFYRHRAVSDWLAHRLSERHYDVAVIEELFLAGYLPKLKRAGCTVVFDAHNVERMLQTEMDWARAGENTRFRRKVGDWVLQRRKGLEEKRAVLEADLVWACSDQDSAGIQREYGRTKGVSVIPNGVNVDDYQRDAASPAGESWEHLPITLASAGAYEYFPNEDAAMRLINGVLPALRSRGHKDARIVLIGRTPTPAMRTAALKDKDIEVTGEVDSVLPYLKQPCIITLPLTLGGGTRLKILEAFAIGRPVVTTPKGAEGINAVDGEHLLIRDGSEAFADAVLELWNDAELRSRLCANALELVREHYSWPSAGRKIAKSLGFAREQAKELETCAS